MSIQCFSLQNKIKIAAMNNVIAAKLNKTSVCSFSYTNFSIKKLSTQKVHSRMEK
jgi:hypothetical protein